MVDCYMADRLLPCPYEQREIIYFTMGGVECRGCRRCPEQGGEGGVTTRGPESQSSTHVPDRTHTTEDATRIDGRMTSVPEEFTITPYRTTATLASETPDDVTPATSGIATASSAITAQTRPVDGSTTAGERDRHPNVDIWERRDSRWVDDSELLAFADDDNLLSEFLNNPRSRNAKDDTTTILRYLMSDNQGSVSPTGSGGDRKRDTEDFDLPPRQAVLDNCPAIDCAAVEYSLNCPVTERVRTFQNLNGFKCELCRRCRHSV